MRITTFRLALAASAALLLSACGGSSPGSDDGIDSHSLGSMVATIWVDPDGCKHWVIDDGLEGYMSPVLSADGKPDCS